MNYFYFIQVCATVVLFFMICPRAVYAQARIAPPSLEFSEIPSNSEQIPTTQSMQIDASSPIPVRLWNTMPFFHWQELDERFLGSADQNRFEVDRRILIGFLHHPAEGAPEWMLELGRQADFQSSGRFISKATYNLEKAFPDLRPGNSDKLASWLALSSIVGRNRHVFHLPELGWTWKQLSSGLVIDFIAPTLARVGYHEDQWTATIGVRQNWRIKDDAARDAGFYIAPERILLVEATRELEYGFSMSFSAGLQLAETTRPHVGFGMAWAPRD